MDIAGKMKKLGFAFHADSFESPLKEGTVAVVFSIEIAGVTVSEFSNKRGNAVFVVLLEDEVKMIGHKAKSDDGDKFFFLGKLS